ncbi:MAG TPA: hypothetical protein VK964_10800 [Nocardioidaceae bacterium]|nr:hypothetical protein [Nocardioidaceae bacterium]
MLKRFLVLLAAVTLLFASPAHAAAWTSSAPDDMWFDRGYIVHNNMWNASGYKVSQTIRADSYKRWQVTATADNKARDGAVKTYPNVHKDYHNWSTGHEPRVRAFRKIRSSFAGRGPRVGIYNVGYDIWLNGVPGNREIMIWTENYRQVPAGRVVARGLKWSNRTWKLYATSDNRYLAFVPDRPMFKGTLPIRGMLGYLIRQGRVPANSTLGQICYGVEIVSTGGKPATFKFTDFSISTARR